MDRLRQDLILAFRRLYSSPGFTLAAILTLALGIGANTAIFTAVNSVLFRDLPVDHPRELVALNTKAFQSEFPVLSYPNYADMRDRNDVLSGLALYRFARAGLSRGNGDNGLLWVYEITGNYMGTLGVNAWRGRAIGPEDDRVRLGHPVVMLTHACWQRRFGSDPGVIGKKIKLNGMDYTVIGITPEGFAGTEMVFTPEAFVPVMMAPQIEPGADWLDRRGSVNSFVIGRLKPGVTMAQVEASLNAIQAQLARQYPKDNEGMRIVLSRPGLFGSLLRGTIRGFSAILLGVSGLVLLIACVNLASLLLARASDRRKDTAIRLALGAERGQLVRQLLTESLVLALLGGAAGLLVAKWLADWFVAWRPPVDIPIIPEIGIDWRVMLFAFAISIVTGLLFGLAPALQTTRASLTSALKNEAVSEKLRTFHLRDVLVSAQIALSVVLLVGSLLVVRSLQHVLNLKLGFDPQHAAQINFDMALQGYDETRGRDFENRLLDRVRALPGIESAGVINGLPLTLDWSNSGIFIEGKPEPRAADVKLAAMYDAGPGYFKTLQTKFTAGRDFEDRDRKGAPRVAIVNQAFVDTLLPGENPLGRRFRTGGEKSPWREIIGVVETGKYRSLGEPATPAVFEAIDQDWSSSITVVARSTMPEPQVAGMLRHAVLELDPSIAISTSSSVADQLGLVLLPARVAAAVLGAFGLLALILAATGVYGVMAYAVSRRTREIGIRMALGAKPGQVVRVVLSRAGVLLAAGAAIGLGLSLAAGRLFAPLLYGISATDPATYAAAIGVMALVAAAACLFPARRAVTVDPVTALRTE
jgi:predicted permease